MLLPPTPHTPPEEGPAGGIPVTGGHRSLQICHVCSETEEMGTNALILLHLGASPASPSGKCHQQSDVYNQGTWVTSSARLSLGH